MVGWGSGNVATQYGGALCAAIGSLAAAKRSCGVGIAFSDPNHKKDGSSSPRGAILAAAQAGAFSDNTPFGRQDGHGIYGAASGDMESYANQVLRKYANEGEGGLPRLPSDARGIDAWNNGRWSVDAVTRTWKSAEYSSTGADYTPLTLAPSSNAATLAANINRSTAAPLNLAPVDGVTTSPLSEDMNQSLHPAAGDMYLLNLHSLAFHQSPLYGSGAGRWFFKAGSDPTTPMLDIASIYQAGRRGGVHLGRVLALRRFVA